MDIGSENGRIQIRHGSNKAKHVFRACFWYQQNEI